MTLIGHHAVVGLSWVELHGHQVFAKAGSSSEDLLQICDALRSYLIVLESRDTAHKESLIVEDVQIVAVTTARHRIDVSYAKSVPVDSHDVQEVGRVREHERSCAACVVLYTSEVVTDGDLLLPRDHITRNCVRLDSL